ncbi:MAG TPA: hypothetical protein VJ917_11205 [Saprospiraceae bacterium]|nr:hypothetical protein [Saprospiraceae bacterium]
MDKKSIFLIVGFVLFCLGTLSIVVSLVGARFIFLSFIDQAGPMGAFLIKISLIAFGLIFVSLSKSLPREKDSSIE